MASAGLLKVNGLLGSGAVYSLQDCLVLFYARFFFLFIKSSGITRTLCYLPRESFLQRPVENEFGGEKAGHFTKEY